MNRRTLVAATWLLLLPVALAAQEGRQAQEERQAREFTLQAMLSGHLFPPEVVLRDPRILDLTDEQAKRIQEMTQAFQAESEQILRELRARNERLAGLFAEESADLDLEAVMARFEQVLEAESRIKRGHLRLLVEIRGVLTPHQRLILSAVMGSGAKD